MSDADAIIDVYQRHACVWALKRGDRLIGPPWLDQRYLIRIDERLKASFLAGGDCLVPVAGRLRTPAGVPRLRLALR